MKRENIGRGQPDVDSLVEFNILGNDCLDDRANPCSKWLDKNILKEDGHPVDYITQAVREVGIDVKSVMKEFKMSSSLELDIGNCTMMIQLLMLNFHMKVVLLLVEEMALMMKRMGMVETIKMMKIKV